MKLSKKATRILGISMMLPIFITMTIIDPGFLIVLAFIIMLLAAVVGLVFVISSFEKENNENTEEDNKRTPT